MPNPENRMNHEQFSERIPNGPEFIEILEGQGLDSHAEAYKKVLAVADDIRQAGGRALLVGGSVRDMMMSKISKDFDIEVYGLDPVAIEQIITAHGKVSDVGKAFGILKLSFGEGIDLDISLPRSDSKTGEGHKGFEVKADPNMSIEDAARRRDFTMNSVSADPITGEFFDPFGGKKDIDERILKVTDPERFKDDPLRVMRALQFVGRFGMSIDPESAKLIQEMAPQLKELPKERIGEEWKKLLLKSEKPSMGLAAGMALGVLKEIHPEFPPLAKTPQEPEWHPEGDVWVHTLMSVDAAADFARRDQLPQEQAMTVILATLCHDLGKATTTEFVNDRFISHGHEPAGEEPTRKFLATIGIDNLTRDKVVKLVVDHLVPSTFFLNEVVKGEKVSDGAYRRFAKRIHPATIQEQVLVSEADHAGRGPFTDPQYPDQLMLPDGFPAGPHVLERARKLQVEDSRPVDLIMGRDLIAKGFKPGKVFGELIQLANDLRDDKNYSRDMFFQALDGIDNEDQAITHLKAVLGS